MKSEPLYIKDFQPGKKYHSNEIFNAHVDDILLSDWGTWLPGRHFIALTDTNSEFSASFVLITDKDCKEGGIYKCIYSDYLTEKIYPTYPKICTGCGHIEGQPLGENAVACCPDANFIPLQNWITETFNKAIELQKFLHTTYVLVSWPDCQEYMDQEWWENEAVLDIDYKTGQNISYFIPYTRWLHFEINRYTF